MGFTIFTQSGTFTPSDYGLKVGDCIHVIAIGGGGGGGTYTGTAATAGGTTSFGSYLTCAGGNAGTVGNGANPPSFQVGSCQGGPTAFALNQVSGGVGGDGYYPGHLRTGGLTAAMCLPTYQAGTSTNISSYPMVASGSSTIFNRQINCYLNGQGNSYIAATSGVPYGNAGRGYSGISAGGVGYGAGGGCGVMDSSSYIGGYGGNSGVLKELDLVLTSTSGISITIGAGGKGAYYSSSSYTYYYASGGGGASGCVAIFW